MVIIIIPFETRCYTTQEDKKDEKRNETKERKIERKVEL